MRAAASAVVAILAVASTTARGADVVSNTFPGLEPLSDAELGGYRVGMQPKFSLPNHFQLIKALKGTKRRCTVELIAAQWRQDLLHQGDSFAHFDNCAFDPGVAFVQEQLAQAKTSADHDAFGAMADLGRALHAIEDFYAHSNYVESMVAGHAQFQVSIDRIDILP